MFRDSIGVGCRMYYRQMVGVDYVYLLNHSQEGEGREKPKEKDTKREANGLRELVSTDSLQFTIRNWD